jgi:hypothetical protein
VHLTDSEFVEHVEGVLRPDRTAHLESCERCRREADGLAAVLVEARAADVPEPSPLFWGHFSAQVRDAIDQPQPSRVAGFLSALPRPGIGLVAAAMIALIVGAVVWPRSVVPPTVSVVVDPVLPPEAAPDALESDPEWTFVATMADGIDWDTAEAAGLSLAPGTAERAAQDLSREEQTELARLLRAELGDGSL